VISPSSEKVDFFARSVNRSLIWYYNIYNIYSYSPVVNLILDKKITAGAVTSAVRFIRFSPMRSSGASGSKDL
jgi:hypothetical protein